MFFLPSLAECELCLQPANHSGFLCDLCLQSLPVDLTPAFITHSIQHLHCSYAYAPPLSNWIRTFKDQHKLSLLPKLVWLMQQQKPSWHSYHALAYVPSSRNKLFKRGFNPAELIATSMASHLQLPLLQRALLKNSDLDQRQLSRRQRLAQSHRSLLAGKLNLQGKNIMLVEDVLTTGATAIAAAHALRQQGAEKVAVWALAHTQLARKTLHT